MDAQTLITYVLSGGGTYAAIAWLWQQCPELKRLDRRTRFTLVVAASLLITGLAYSAGLWAGYIVYSPGGLLNTALAAFGVSQLLWGSLEAKSPPVNTETIVTPVDDGRG